MAYKIKANQNTEGLIRKVSTVFKLGDVIAFDGNEVRPATTGDTKIAGLCMQDVRTTDADFDTEGLEVLVDVYEFENSAEFEVTGGDADATKLYETFDVDAADAGKLAIGAAGTQWFVVEIVSPTKVIAKLAKRFV